MKNLPVGEIHQMDGGPGMMNMDRNIFFDWLYVPSSYHCGKEFYNYSVKPGFSVKISS